MFEKQLEEYDIVYHRIGVATPRHNGKAEMQHNGKNNKSSYNILSIKSIYGKIEY